MLQAGNRSLGENGGSFKYSILVLVLAYKSWQGWLQGRHKGVTLHGVVTQTKMGDPGQETWELLGQPNTFTDTEKPIDHARHGFDKVKIRQRPLVIRYNDDSRPYFINSLGRSRPPS